MTNCITYIMLGQCSVFARGQHYHPCPECYENVPCELECSAFEENLEDGVYRASHCVCDTCQTSFGMVPHV